jgi:glycosyltransferase involved in cell wall biosynthesis
MKNKLTVIIPSRKQEKQIYFIQRATESVRKQTIANQFEITFIVGVDKGCGFDPTISDILGVSCIESDGASQAKALNSAIRQVQEGFVAFLEDDDQWMPEYLNYAMHSIEHYDFVSSTQAEFDENDEFLRINDFPTPSGWLMPVTTLNNVGQFNEGYRFHLDNEWLGRLSERGLKRVHMVEATAPIYPQYIYQVRPWLWNILNLSAGFCSIARHQSPYPLVKRLVHSKSGMAQIASNEELFKISQNENERLIQRFGRTPW